MTDKEITKALECCGKNVLYENCGNCPYEKDFGKDHICTIKVAKDALALINRQQAEIEKLNVELVGMRGACESYKMHYDNAKAEIERLQVRLRKERHQFDDLGKMYSEIRAEAIKEFADKVKDNQRILFNYIYSNADFGAIIDNLVKEMVGEGK